MQIRIFILISFFFFSLYPSYIWAEDGYIGEDLGNDIYKRLDEGTYKLKKQLIEKRLKGSMEMINKGVGTVCSTKEGTKIDCFIPGVDFTLSELDEISAGGLGAIYTHMNPKNIGIDTERAVRIRGIVLKYYTELQKNVTYDQKKLQSVGSIGLFTDGNKDNSSYDLMTDLENIHNVIFAKDIPYNGTSNMGASSVANLLADLYPHGLFPLNPIDNPLMGTDVDPGVSLIPPTTLTGLTLSGLLNSGSGCVTPSQLPTNIDPDFLRDAQAQLLVGTNPNSSVAFADEGKLPEYWAKIGQGAGGSLGGAGGGSDKFPCSGKDFFCIIISMTNYTQNVLGGKMATIEYILDENLKIANKFAPASSVQAKMTKMFFGLSLKNLDLPSMLHIGVVVSRLPPPILNLKQGTTGGEANASGPLSKGEEDEFNKILVGTFEEMGLDFKRQNALLERNNESRMVHNLPYLTTDSVNEKSDTSQTPMKSGFIQAKEMELKKSYGDSFNDDLFELHNFTLAFSKSIKNITDIITAMHAIPQK